MRCYLGESLSKLNRTYSLKRHKEFHYTYRTGRRFGGRSFALVTARNREKRVQVGFSVSKKVGNSVQRNRAKRRLKACFSPLVEQVKPGFNLIFIARSEALTIPFTEMEREMKRVLEKAAVLKEPSSQSAVREP